MYQMVHPFFYAIVPSFPLHLFPSFPHQTFGFVALALLLLELNFKPPLLRGIVCLWNMDGLK